MIRTIKHKESVGFSRERALRWARRKKSLKMKCFLSESLPKDTIYIETTHDLSPKIWPASIGRISSKRRELLALMVPLIQLCQKEGLWHQTDFRKFIRVYDLWEFNVPDFVKAFSNFGF